MKVQLVTMAYFPQPITIQLHDNYAIMLMKHHTCTICCCMIKYSCIDIHDIEDPQQYVAILNIVVIANQ